MIGGAKGIGLGIDLGLVNQYNRTGSQSYIEPEVLDSLVGVWSAYGMTNDSPNRSTIKNKLSNKGGDFVISNASFKLNSGFGKYEQDFTDWKKSFKVTSFDSESIKFTSDVSWVLLYHPSSIGEDIPSFKVRIKLYGEGTLYYNYINQEGTYTNVAVKSEIFETPICYNTKYIGEKGVNVGFTLGVHSGECSGTITQIPSFEGAFFTDGIDDLITSTKTVQEMLGGSNEITVVSMIHQIGLGCRTNFICDKGSYWRCNEVANTGEGKTGIYGYSSTNISVNTPNIINNVLGDKVDYSVTGDRNDLTPSQFSVVGYISSSGKISYTSSVAWYWTIIANKVLTTDEINQVIAYFNLDRTLKPDIYCDIAKQGITNDNHADFNDKLVDYSGNGRDIQMYNLAWKGGSGVAAKQYESLKDWRHTPFAGTTVIRLDEFSYNIVSNNGGYWQFRVDKTNEPTSQIRVITDRKVTWINNIKYAVEGESSHKDKYKTTIIEANTPTIINIAGFDFFDPIEGGTFMSVLNYGQVADDKGYTLTILPSCKGGILLDGVNDFGKVTGMPIYKDYTFIIDYERISYTSPEVWTAPVVSKAHTVGQGAFILMLANREVELSRQSNSFGSTTTFNRDDFTRTLLYQSKYKCGDVNLTIGEGVDGDTLWLGTLRNNDYRFFNGAIYSLMSFPYSMSEFLIERQLKKHKLGTLYPDMVEFRPVINSNVLLDSKPTFVIRGTSTYLNAGDYVPENSQIWVSIKMNNIADRITKFTVNGKTIDIPENAYSEVTLQYGFPFVIDKSPQKITMTIEQDENYVQLNPIINGGSIFKYLNVTTNKEIFVGDYIHKGDTIRFYVSNISGTVNEVSSFTVNGVEGIPKGTNGDLFDAVVTKSPQKINITIDEYIRYEDIIQPYPVLLRFNDENGNEVSWGGKFKVGSTITRIGSAADSNLLPNIYNIFGLLLNGNQVTSSKAIVEKTMVFKAKSAYIFDNNQPNCILSPRLLSIPNSSYKILGYIPDISGNGNHGVIHNSAYAGASGANGYLQNFSGWTKGSGVSSTDSVISSSNNLVAANGWIAYVTSGTVIPTFKVEISGIPINSNLRFEGSGQTLVNGVNTIQGLTTTKISGFYISNGYDNDWSNLRIEQVGEYEGAYCLDGVDDFVTIPTLSSGGKQVLMKVNSLNSDVNVIYDQRLPTNMKGTFAIMCDNNLAYSSWNTGQTYIDGMLNKNITGNQLVNITHNLTITHDGVTNNNSKSPFIGKSTDTEKYAKMALYDFMLFDNISTDDKIKQLNEYVGTEGNTEWRKTK